jgi:hypothetical protein
MTLAKGLARLASFCPLSSPHRVKLALTIKSINQSTYPGILRKEFGRGNCTVRFLLSTVKLARDIKSITPANLYSEKGFWQEVPAFLLSSVLSPSPIC